MLHTSDRRRSVALESEAPVYILGIAVPGTVPELRKTKVIEKKFGSYFFKIFIATFKKFKKKMEWISGFQSSFDQACG